MHKNIALIIEKIIKESPYDHFQCEVIPNTTDGFWKCKISFTSRKDAHSESLVRLLPLLGMVHGEGLSISDNIDTVVVS